MSTRIPPGKKFRKSFSYTRCSFNLILTKILEPSIVTGIRRTFSVCFLGPHVTLEKNEAKSFECVMKLIVLLVSLYKFASPTNLFKYMYICINIHFFNIFLPHFNEFISSLVALVWESDRRGSVGEAEEAKVASVWRT